MSVRSPTHTDRYVFPSCFYARLIITLFQLTMAGSAVYKNLSEVNKTVLLIEKSTFYDYNALGQQTSLGRIYTREEDAQRVQNDKSKDSPNNVSN